MALVFFRHIHKLDLSPAGRIQHCIHDMASWSQATHDMVTERGAGITKLELDGPKGSSPSTTAQPTGDRIQGRSREIDPKRRHSTGGTNSTPVLEQGFRGPKERRNPRASHKSECV